MWVGLTGIIEVFVRNQKVVVEGECVVPQEPAHPCSGTTSTVAYSEESVLPQADQQVLDLARAVAEEKGLQVRVHNLATRMGKLRASLKGVEKTPAIIVGAKKLVGNTTKTDILEALVE
jgi:hypothetical protein